MTEGHSLLVCLHPRTVPPSPTPKNPLITEKGSIFCFQNHCLQRKKENFSQQVLFGRKGVSGTSKEKKKHKKLSIAMSTLKGKFFFLFFFPLLSVGTELIKVLK